MKTLTSIQALHYLNDIAHGRIMIYDPQDLKNIVEKSLKALNIIKDKIKIDFNDHYFGIKDNYYIIVNNDLFKAIKVDKEQFYLLKKVYYDK